MQAVIYRTTQVPRALLLAVVLSAGILLGGIGGYTFGQLVRHATGTATSVRRTRLMPPRASRGTRQSSERRAIRPNRTFL